MAETVFLIATGETYTTLAGWEAGEEADITATGSNVNIVAEIEAGSAVECATLEFGTGWTMDSTHYCIIRAADGDKFDSDAMTGATITTTSATYLAILRADNYLHFEDVGVITCNTTSDFMYFNTGAYAFFDRCVFDDVTRYNGNTSSRIVYTNCLFKITHTTTSSNPIGQTLKNCTIIQPSGLGSWSGDVAVHTSDCDNVVVYNENTKSSYNTFYNCTGDYNAQNDNGSADPPGANSISTVTSAVFSNYAGGNFHLASDSTVLNGAGDDLSGTFTDDFDGDTRSAWDIGFDCYVAAGSGITGTGSPQAQTATSTGTAQRVVIGSAAAAATTATSTGTGIVGAVVTGSGSPAAEVATSTGTAEREITGSGNPQATTATSTGTGLRLITGSGSPQAVTATSNSSGDVGTVIDGSGSPQASTATSTGVGLRLIGGTAAAQAETATSSGTAEREITSSGSPQAETATSTGLGIVGDAIIGTGTPQAETATSTGVALRVITGSGIPQAETAASTGAAEREITGTGTSSAAIATSTGTILRVITGSGSPQASTATSSGYDSASTIHPGRIYTVEPENRVYTVEDEDRYYVV